ncbi:uncharacterized protein LOC130073738 [Rhinichthys klamathensis goyatoka]|uniref:uncharacterized protein LOC130073738 n=1 Tax=Rhinichthys klamathensis goyatoka TaxID=3034132 RepID=UPI0024B524BE|nr:uncharacterized protein LOC130073738 [Rhinichthys klamathensis goyatoka]
MIVVPDRSNSTAAVATPARHSGPGACNPNHRSSPSCSPRAPVRLLPPGSASPPETAGPVHPPDHASPREPRRRKPPSPTGRHPGTVHTAPLEETPPSTGAKASNEDVLDVITGWSITAGDADCICI